MSLSAVMRIAYATMPNAAPAVASHRNTVRAVVSPRRPRQRIAATGVGGGGAGIAAAGADGEKAGLGGGGGIGASGVGAGGGGSGVGGGGVDDPASGVVASSVEAASPSSSLTMAPPLDGGNGSVR
jgi:hypothetical protein